MAEGGLAPGQPIETVETVAEEDLRERRARREALERRVFRILALVILVALLLGVIFTFRRIGHQGETQDFQVCLDGATAQALLDVGQGVAHPPDSFGRLEDIATSLDWRAACDRVLEDGISPDEVSEGISLAILTTRYQALQEEP